MRTPNVLLRLSRRAVESRCQFPLASVRPAESCLPTVIVVSNVIATVVSIVSTRVVCVARVVVISTIRRVSFVQPALSSSPRLSKQLKGLPPT